MTEPSELNRMIKEFHDCKNKVCSACYLNGKMVNIDFYFGDRGDASNMKIDICDLLTKIDEGKVIIAHNKVTI